MARNDSPPPVTMFGVYVSNLSVSIGLGGQGGNMQLTLVEDEDNGVILPKDGNGQPFFGGGTNSPTTGTACYFKYGNFYFGGVFQRWTYNNSTSGRTYNVVLESPSKLMDGVQIILEDFNGASDKWYANTSGGSSSNVPGLHAVYGDVNNVFNVFAAYENPTYGANGTNINFGASGFNTSGMPLDKLLVGMDILIKADSANVFGGPITFGVTEAGAAGTEYSLNLTDLADFFEEESIDFGEYRLKGPVKNINGIFSEMAELFQFDYFFSCQHRDTNLNELPDGGGRIPNAEIAVKIISKRQAPEKDEIKKFIDADLQKPFDERRVMNYQLGKEFADTTTQKIVWGGRRTRYLKLTNVANQYAIWGRQSAQVKRSYNAVGRVGEVYGNPLQGRTIYIENFGAYKCSPFEMRMAQAGKESWTVFKTFEVLAQREPNGYNLFTAPWQATFDLTSNIITLLAGGNAGNSFDLTTTAIIRANKRWVEESKAITDAIYSGVNGIAGSGYSTEFLLSLPTEVSGPGYNIYEPNDEFVQLKSWEVSDSAFDPFPLTNDIANFDGVGRITSLVGYAARTDCDYSTLGSDYASGLNLASGLIVSKKGTPERESFFDTTGFFSGAFMCFYSTGGQVKLFDSITTPDFGLTVLAKTFFNIDLPPVAYVGSGKSSMNIAIPPDVLLPALFGVPQESGRFNYGPWVTEDFSKPFGKAEAFSDESLRPETFGGYDQLNSIGIITAAVAQTDLYQSETGQVQMTGAPDFNVGERFASNGPYVSNMTINVDATGGATTTYKFNTWTPEFGKIAKYNIDRIAKVNKNRFNFLKKQRDQVEKRPFPQKNFKPPGMDLRDKMQAAGQDAYAWYMLFGARNVGGTIK